MQRILAAATALLLASCDTMGPQDGPYGAPEPYPPGAQYPGGDPYPPQMPYPPGGPIDACPIQSSRDWRARIAPGTGPETRTMLVLTGTVVAPTGGYRMEFVPNLTILRSYPAQAVARLLPIPPQGPATQALTTHDVRWQWPLAGPVGTVAIRCGDRTLAQITPIGG
jgi:hypothetical protein